MNSKMRRVKAENLNREERDGKDGQNHRTLAGGLDNTYPRFARSGLPGAGLNEDSG